MKRFFNIGLFLGFLSCAPQRIVYRTPHIDAGLINAEYVSTQKTVHLVFYARNNELHEVDGVIRSASEENGVAFEYFNSQTHQLMSAKIPMKNIYEISVFETHYDKNQKIIHYTLIGFAAIFLGAIVVGNR
jgi:hypothetical protein